MASPSWKGCSVVSLKPECRYCGETDVDVLVNGADPGEPSSHYCHPWCGVPTSSLELEAARVRTETQEPDTHDTEELA